jgi:hypothetical protein
MATLSVRPVALTAGLLAAVAGLLSSSAAPASAQSPRPGPLAAAVRGPARPVPVLLINGDRLLAGPASAITVLRAPATAVGGPPSVLIGYSCGPSAASPSASQSAASRSVRIPAAALPYLGRGLDPSLFSIGALERAERGGRLPVTISYRGRRPRLPGVTITGSSHGIADGYLTDASAGLFGRALDRQFRADHARDSYGTDGLFSGGLSIALGGTRPARARRPRPAYPMHTLTVRGTNLAGQPDNGDQVAVFNADNCNKLDPGSAFNTFTHGTTRFSVPAGHYWAIGQFEGSSTFRLAVLSQFTVSGSKTVAMSARSATGRIGFATPRPAKLAQTSFALLRAGHGYTEGIFWATLGRGSPLRVSPVRRPPTVGTLQAYTFGQLTSPAGRGVPYNYTLDFPAPPGTIPSSLHYAARAAGLATVRDRYYQDTRSSGDAFTFGGTPAEVSGVGGVSLGFTPPMPGSQIQYLSARPPMIWSSGYTQFSQAGSGGQAGAFRVFHSGQQVTADWGRYPLHPTASMVRPGTQGLGSSFPTLPTASRAGNLLTLDMTPFGDNQPGDTGSGYAGSCGGIRCTGTYALYQNGRKIAGGNAVKAAGPFTDLLVQARLSPRPARLAFVLTASRASRRYRLSATSRDVWTWPTRREPAATVPAPWTCGVATRPSGQLIYPRRCAVQPMLTLAYQIARLSLSGSTRPGRQVISINVRHLQLSAPARITRASLAVSFNGGRTWHAARVTRTASGRFRAVFTAPARTAITLRTRAADAVGAQLTETITRAYQTAT